MSSRHPEEAIERVDDTINALFYTADRIFDIINHQEPPCIRCPNRGARRSTVPKRSSCCRSIAPTEEKEKRRDSEPTEEGPKAERELPKPSSPPPSTRRHSEKSGGRRKIRPQSCTEEISSKLPSDESTFDTTPLGETQSHTRPTSKGIRSEDLTTTGRSVVPALMSEVENSLTAKSSKSDSPKSPESSQSRKSRRSKSREKKPKAAKMSNSALRQRKQKRMEERERQRDAIEGRQKSEASVEPGNGHIEIRSVSSFTNRTGSTDFKTFKNKVPYSAGEKTKVLKFNYPIGKDSDGSDASLPATITLRNLADDWLSVHFVLYKACGNLLMELSTELKGETTRNTTVIGEHSTK